MSNRFHNKFHRHNHHTNPTNRETNYPDSAYDPIASREFPFQGEFFTQGDICTTRHLVASGNSSVYDGLVRNDLTVGGDILCTGNKVTFDTLVYASSAVRIDNSKAETALYISQTGNAAVAQFYKGDFPVLHLGVENVGVGTADPNESLTVIGSVSSTGVIYEAEHSSNDWNSVYTTVKQISSTWQGTSNTFQNVSAGLAALNDIGINGPELLRQLLSGNLIEPLPLISAVKMQASLEVSSGITTKANLSAGGDLAVAQNMSVGTSAQFGGSVTIGASATVGGSLAVAETFGFGKLAYKDVSYNENYIDSLDFTNAQGYNDIHIVLTTENSVGSTIEISTILGVVPGNFFIVTNGLVDKSLAFVAGDDIFLRGRAIKLILEPYECCCLKVQQVGDNPNAVSVW